MYEQVINLMNDRMKGDTYISIEREERLWVVYIKDHENNIYFAYTVGKENKDFLYECLENVHTFKYTIKIVC